MSEIFSDPQARTVVARMPGGSAFLDGLAATPPRADVVQAFVDAQVGPGEGGLARLEATVGRFVADVNRAHAASAAAAHGLAADNFQSTFGAHAVSAAETRSYFQTVRGAIVADPELRVALRKLPEGAAVLQALDGNDVPALQRAINQRVSTGPLATDGQYGPGTHDALLSYLGVARLALEHAPDGPATLRQELALDFDRALGLGGLRRIPTDERLRQHCAALLAELAAAPQLKTFIAGLPAGQRILDALGRSDALELNRVFGTGDPAGTDMARSGYDFATHSALVLYLDNAKQRYVATELERRSDAAARAGLDAARRQQFTAQLGTAPDGAVPS
jgi:hypothetical protein